MSNNPSIDVDLQVFGKPWQTALALLTLDKYMGSYINNIFFIIESSQPKNDSVDVSLLENIVSKMKIIFFATMGWIRAHRYVKD